MLRCCLWHCLSLLRAFSSAESSQLSPLVSSFRCHLPGVEGGGSLLPLIILNFNSCFFSKSFITFLNRPLPHAIPCHPVTSAFASYDGCLFVGRRCSSVDDHTPSTQGPEFNPHTTTSPDSHCDESSFLPTLITPCVKSFLGISCK